MIITHKLNMDLVRSGATPILHAVQNDTHCRMLEITLYSGGERFRFPENAGVLIRYRNPDGSGGEYDTLSDGSRAWEIYRNILTVRLVPQMTVLPGTVHLTVSIVSRGRQVSVFPVTLCVQPVAHCHGARPENYFYVTGFLPSPEQSAPGQLLQVAQVDDTGHVTAVQAVDAPPGGDTSGEDVRQRIEEALAQAKASGTFDGKPGADGYTPVKGTDYFTDADKKEFLSSMNAVRYVDQGLTDAQKAQSRKNIAAVGVFAGNAETITPSQIGQAITSGENVLVSYVDPTLGAFVFTDFTYSEAVPALLSSAIVEMYGTMLAATIYGFLDTDIWHLAVKQIPTTADIPSAVNDALAQAKESGEFDGANGEDGYTPIKGVDYFTDVDKTEWEAYIAEELAKRGQLTPAFANSTEECTDTEKMYVLPDGYIYAYMQHEEIVEGGTVANFTNLLTDSRTVIKRDVRYSQSSAAFRDLTGCDSVIVPIPTSGSVTIRMRGCGRYSGYPNVYGGTDFNGVTFATTFISGDSGWKTDGNGDTYFTFTNTAGCTCIVFMTPTVDTASDIVTANEEIIYTTSEGGTTVVEEWTNTGHAFVPADYEDRIVALEEKVDSFGSSARENETEVFAPSPQLPADGSDGADFNAVSMTAQDIYNVMDAAAAAYPNYITKEVLSQDAGGALDIPRYTLCRHYYKAWQQVNYPAMYAWVNGSTVVYSRSVSPRIGDTLYTTTYVGTAKAAVTAVDNAAQTRTAGGVVYTRDSSKDVPPTLVFTSIIGNGSGGTVYNADRTTVTTVSAVTDSTMTGVNGVSYVRYPMGDRDYNMVRPPVVVLAANEHGFTPDPRIPAILCTRLVRDLAACKTADNAFLNHLKNECMVVILPVVNPYGFNRSDGSGYYNANGVNINRNYDCPGWGNLDDTGTGAQGSYGGSEIETQNVMNTITQSGADVAVSIHALGHSTNGGNILTHYQGNGFDARKIAGIAQVMAANYNLQFTNYGATPPDTEQGGKSPAYITWAGAKGGLIEMQAEGSYPARYSAEIMEANYTLLLQCVHMWLTDHN